MSDKSTFIDSNILLYLFTDDYIKKQIAIQLLSPEYIISTQVINENINVCIKKLRLSKEEAYAHGINLISIFNVVPVQSTTVQRATQVSLKYNLSFWDSLIVAAALENNCNMLLSEDMHHGLVIDRRLKIENPFI